MHGRRKEEEAEMGIARATHLAQPVGRKGLAAAACGLALAGRAGNRRGEDGACSIASPRPASSSSSPSHPLARSRLVLAGSGFSSPDLVVATRIWAGPRRIELILAGSGGGRHHVLHAASSSAPEERR